MTSQQTTLTSFKMAQSMLARLGNLSLARNVRLVQTSAVSRYDANWRYQKGLSRNPNAYGPLTDNRDFSYVDGRPVPLGIGQQTRQEKQRGYAEKIIRVVKEMEFAVEHHSRRMKLEAEKRQAVLDSKLKPKGHLMLQRPKTES